MPKSNKELAVEVAIEYIKGIHNQTSTSAGIQQNSLNLDSCCKIIKGVYKTLNSLESDKNE